MTTGGSGNTLLELLLSRADPKDLPALRARLGAIAAPYLPTVPDGADAGAESPVEPPTRQPAVELLERTRPARTLAAVLLKHTDPADDTDSPDGTDDPDDRLPARLGELIRCHLGADPSAWLRLHALLGGHRGTLPEALAAAGAGRGAAAPDSWPPKSVHDTLGLLLEHTPPELLAPVVRHLPDATVEHLLAGGSLPGPHLSEAVRTHGDTRTRAALAGHRRIDARTLAGLVAADDPTVNAAVYRNPRSTHSLRRLIAHQAGTGKVPLDPQLRSELIDGESQFGADRRNLAPLLGSGDPALAASALRIETRASAERYALLRIWELHGPAAVREVLDGELSRRYPRIKKEVDARVRTLLDAADGAERLRAETEPYEDPARLPELLRRTRGTSTLRNLLQEPYVHDFAALAAANRESPFMPKAAEELSRHEDGDPVGLREFRLSHLNESWRVDGRRGGCIRTPAERLATEALDGTAGYWAQQMATAGLLDPADLIGLARPAHRAAEALNDLAERTRGTLPGTAEAMLSELVRTHLTGNPNAWAVLLETAPAFTGTLAELLALAEQIAAPRAGETALAVAVPTADAGPVDEAPVPVEPSARPDREPNAEPSSETELDALAAVHLLRELGGRALPLPDEPGVLEFLRATPPKDEPGWAVPDWLIAACRTAGVPDPEDTDPAPLREEILAHFRAHFAEGEEGVDSDEAKAARSDRALDEGSARYLELAHLHGVLTPNDLLDVLPARFLNGYPADVPRDWRRLGYPRAWGGALSRLLDRELGTDGPAWRQLALVATSLATSNRTWPELLRLSRAEAEWRAIPGVPELLAGLEGDAESATRHLALIDSYKAVRPTGTLLRHAPSAAALSAAFGALGPEEVPAQFAELLCERQGVQYRAAARHLIGTGEPAALRVLARLAERLYPDQADALADRAEQLRDPELLLLLAEHARPHTALRIINGPVPIAHLVAASPAPVPGGALWLRSREPALIERVLREYTKDLDLPQKLTGCLNLLALDGPQRLAALLPDGLLGATVTRLGQRALATADPAAVLTARAEKELATPRLIKRLRSAEASYTDTELLLTRVPWRIDWALLEAEHAREPFQRLWGALLHLGSPPREVLDRQRHVLRGYLRVRPGPEAIPWNIPAATAPGALTALLDEVLEENALSGRRLARETSPAARVLRYLEASRRRPGAPSSAAAARTELAALIRSRLGSDPAAWRLVLRRLTGREPGWNELTDIEALLTVPQVGDLG
jgi:hypothetical protein